MRRTSQVLGVLLEVVVGRPLDVHLDHDGRAGVQTLERLEQAAIADRSLEHDAIEVVQVILGGGGL